jgi:hypothetical protein
MKNLIPMDAHWISNPTVRAAIYALQLSDRVGWADLFERDAKLYDDGENRTLERFSREALGHGRFTSIDSISPNGLEVRGRFHSERSGHFSAYFRFHLSTTGKIRRLDVGPVL